MRLVHRDIDERAARQPHFRRTRRVRTAFAPLQHTRRRQQLGTMAHRRNRLAGLVEGDAHVIRNAGGRASDDAIRSLVISYKLLGTAEWFVIHHSDCGMEFFTNKVIGDLLANSLETAALGDEVEWLWFPNDTNRVDADGVTYDHAGKNAYYSEVEWSSENRMAPVIG